MLSKTTQKQLKHLYEPLPSCKILYMVRHCTGNETTSVCSASFGFHFSNFLDIFQCFLSILNLMIDTVPHG